MAVLDYLGIKTLLDPERECSGADESFTQMAANAKEHSWEIKAALAIRISSADSPVAIAQKLLGKLGLYLNQVRREHTPEGKAGRRVYRFTPPTVEEKTSLTLGCSEIPKWRRTEIARCDPGEVIKNIYITPPGSRHSNLGLSLVTSS